MSAAERAVVHHGDALDILPTLPLVDLVVTDPPYIIGAVSAGNLASKAGGWQDMMNSAMWFAAWYRAAWDRLARTGAMWTCCNWRSLPVVMRAALDAGIPCTSCLVWDKKWIGPSGPQGLRSSHEFVVLMARDEFAIPNRGLADVVAVQASGHKPTGHPAEKPVALMRWLIEQSGLAPGSLVLDPFAGSGTTLRAALDLGHRAIGIEAEERWVHVARSRAATMSLLDIGEAA